MITLTINGTPHDLCAETVAAMVEELALPGQLLLVEHNGIALSKSEWEKCGLQEGDRLEILRISAGG